MPYNTPLKKKRWARRYYKRNRAKIIARSRANEVANPERTRAKKEKWHQENLRAHKMRCRKRYKANREQFLRDCKEWQRQHPEQVRQYKRTTDARYRETLDWVYVRRLLKARGIKFHPIHSHKLRNQIRICRTQPLFRLMAAITKLQSS